ncbi:putative disease resistance protein RGA3 [Pyrus communis]|uniref:putative disease resistance protein RGA3 n=1 Tax=Pyrus communis TaxID=23211 RepID=UPI0035C1C08C
MKKAASLAAQEFSFLWEFEKEYTRLRDSLSITQAMLRDAEQSQVWSEAVELWVKKLEDIAHDADDVLDEYGYEVLRREVELRNQMKKKMLNFVSHQNPIAFRFKTVHKIKNINASLDNLNKMAASTGLVPRSTLIVDPTSSRDIGLLDSRETVSCFVRDEIFIVGRGVVASEIVTTLINSINTQETVLSLEQKKTGMQGKDAILRNLQEDLKGKRYLLVLDDVWNKDSHKWNDLMSCLLSVKDTQGSNILITNRGSSVASIVKHFVGMIWENFQMMNVWLILKDKAFPDGVLF